MLDNVTGGSGIVVTFGAAACMLSLLVLMGLKLKWFRARMNFDQPPKTTDTTYVGVYRSNFSDAFDYRRPSELPPVPAYLATNRHSAEVNPVASSSRTNQASTKSMLNLTTLTELNERKPKAKATTGATAKELKDTNVNASNLTEVPKPNEKERKVKGEKVPKVKEVKEPKVKAVKEPKVKESKVKEPKVKEVNEPKDKAVKQPKEKAVKEPKVKEVKEPKLKAVKEPKVKEPKVKVVKTKEAKTKPPKEKGSKKKGVTEGEISQNNTFPYVQSNNGAPSPPPMQHTSPNGVKTFSSMQTSSDITPIPQRVIRNPVAMGAQEYTPPPRGMVIGDSAYDSLDSEGYVNIGVSNNRMNKSWGSSQQYIYDMDEESET